MSLLNWHGWRSIVRFTSREATRPDHDRPELRTRFLALPPRRAWDYVQACLEGLIQAGGWRMEDDELPGSGQFHLTRLGLLRWLVCDVTVTLWPADERRVGLDVISASRGGGLDFGQNGRNIRDFYRALEADLQRLPADGGNVNSECRTKKNSECGIRNSELKKNVDGGVPETEIKKTEPGTTIKKPRAPRKKKNRENA